MQNEDMEDLVHIGSECKPQNHRVAGLVNM